MSIELQGVSRRYGDTLALDAVDLVIEPGSFQSVFGPPGAGKSVLMRLLLGLETPDQGRILIDGVDVTDKRPRERDFAMVFQNLALFPHMSARENIAFPLRRQGFAERDIATRLAAVAEPLGIGPILDKRPAALSGGERQRVAIGRSLIRPARAHLMDEPIAALDARLREDMRVELKRLQRELGYTFIYVTHDHEEAMSVADSMAILERGRVVQVAEPDTIYDRPVSLYVAELVGAPPINVLHGELADGALAGAHGSVVLTDDLRESLSRPSASGRGALAFRPDAVRVVQPGAQSCAAAQGAALRFAGRVADVETLGAFSVARVDVAGTRLRALLPGFDTLATGSAVTLEVAAADVMPFAGEGMKRLDIDASECVGAVSSS